MSEQTAEQAELAEAARRAEVFDTHDDAMPADGMPKDESEDETPPVEASEDAPPSADDEPLDDDPPQKRTANERIQELINDRRARDEQLAAQQQQIQQMENRFQAVLERVVPKNTEPEFEVPDFDADPAGHLIAKTDLQEATVEELQAQLAQMQQAQAQQAQVQQLAHQFNTLEAQYAQENEQYLPAVQKLREARTNMWVQMGYDPATAAQQVQAEAMHIISNALTQGRNPAHAFWAAAQPYATEVALTPQAPAPAPAQRPGTLGSRTPAAPQGVKTLADLAKLSDAEFARAMEDGTWHEVHKNAGLV